MIIVFHKLFGSVRTRRATKLNLLTYKCFSVELCLPLMLSYGHRLKQTEEEPVTAGAACMHCSHKVVIVLTGQ